MKRFYLLLLVVVGLIALPSVLGATDCFINLTSGDPSFIEVGKVSTQGHFNANLASLFAYNLWCPSAWPFSSGSVSFTFVNSTNGSTHVGLVNAFNGEVLLGFQDSCYMRQSVCNAEESCIFKTDGDNNTHVADCNTPNFPMANSFDYPVCCKLTEICNNGVDDDEDGYIDCADSDCYGDPLNIVPPEECTGSPMNTTFCTGPQNATCIGQPPEDTKSFYCGYGITDDPTNPPGTP